MNHSTKLSCAIAFTAVFSAHAGSYEDFFTAIRNDNASNLESLLERGFDANTLDPKGQSGLTMALQEGSQRTLKLLINRAGVDIEALNNAGESPLMMAALKGDIAAAQLLLDRGAKVNRPGWSALHYAAAGPEPKLVQLLIDHGADLNAGSPNDTTPLMMAAQYGGENSVDLLLARGADMTRKNQMGLRAVDFARLSGREPLVRKLSRP